MKNNKINILNILVLLSTLIYISMPATSVRAEETVKENHREVNVDSNNFREHFKLNGDAKYYGSLVGPILGLTRNYGHESGNATLKTKIDMSQNFEFTAKVTLGDKAMDQGGGDGLGIMFHPGDTAEIGKAGNAMGIGGIKGAFGFKLDTYFNVDSTPVAGADPISMYPNKAFGAFVDGRDGKATTLAEGALEIPAPFKNVSHDLVINYDGVKKNDDD